MNKILKSNPNLWTDLDFMDEYRRLKKIISQDIGLDLPKPTYEEEKQAPIDKPPVSLDDIMKLIQDLRPQQPQPIVENPQPVVI